MEEEGFQIMLSYRITDAGAFELGGDGTVPRMKNWLVAQGFSVFVGESSLQGGMDWARTIQSAVDKCEVFVAICSPDYGNTTWTYRELSMADNKKSAAIVPVWHSGAFPPSHVEIILGGTQRVPQGNKCLSQCTDGEWETAMQQLLTAFKTRGCVPRSGAQFSQLSVDEHVSIWPNGDRVNASDGSDSPTARSPKSIVVPKGPISWGLLTAMTAPLRQFLEQEGIRLEVAWQLSEEWGVTTVDDLALIDEDDVARLGLKVIDVKRLRTTLNKAQHMNDPAPAPGDPEGQGSPTGTTSRGATTPVAVSRPASASLKVKYLGARTRRPSTMDHLQIPAVARTGSTMSPSPVPAGSRHGSVMSPVAGGAAGIQPLRRSATTNNNGSPASGSASPVRLSQNGTPPPTAKKSGTESPVPDPSRRLVSVVGEKSSSNLSPAKRRPIEPPLAASRRTTEPGVSDNGSHAPPLKHLTASVERFTLKGHTGTIASLAFSPDCAMLASGSSQYDRSIKIWSVQHGELRADLIGHGSAILSVGFSWDNRILASASKDKNLKLWDVSLVMEGGRSGGYSDKLSAASTLSGHTAEATGVAFTPDGKQLVSAANDRLLKVWDVGTASCTATLTGHTKGVNAVAINQSDGRMAVSGGADGTVRVWDLRNGRCTRTLAGGHPGGINAVALTVDGLQLLSAAGDNRTMRLYDMRSTGQNSNDSRALQGHAEGLTGVCVIPGLGTAASSSHDKTCKVWDLASGTVIGTLQSHSASASCIAAASDGATLATLASGSVDETVKVSIVGLATT